VRIVVHNTAQSNSSDNFPSYAPDNHHSSDDVYWREGSISRVTDNKLKVSRITLSKYWRSALHKIT